MMTVITGVIVFSAAVFLISYRTGKAETIERGKLAAYIVLLMWASFFWGLFIMWISK